MYVMYFTQRLVSLTHFGAFYCIFQMYSTVSILYVYIHFIGNKNYELIIIFLIHGFL